MKKIFLIVFIFFSLLKTALIYSQTNNSLSLEITSKNTQALIDRSNAYDYSPTAISDNQNNWQVWFCGYDNFDGYGGDSLYYTALNSQKQTIQAIVPVIRHTNRDLSEDGLHACAPSVVKQSTPLIENGKEYFKMYYECAPRLYSLENGALTGLGFTQICHAVSTDGLTWQKYNESLWNTQYRYGDINTEVTPVIKVQDKVLQNCQYQEINGKKYASFPGNNQACSDNGLNYGVGHPSALVMNVDGSQQIWLYYYDSRGVWADRGVYLAKSWDGFHFETPVKTNLQNPIDVKYISSSVPEIGGYFIGTLGIYTDNYYAYSADGITWTWPSTPNPDLKFGQALANHCPAPAQPVFVANQSGILNSPNVDILSSEGFWGKNDGCTSTNGCLCYNAAEDDTRGSTWGMYWLQGNIKQPTSLSGDLNFDQKVDILDLRFFLTKFLESLNLFDYNEMVGNFGKGN